MQAATIASAHDVAFGMRFWPGAKRTAPMPPSSIAPVATPDSPTGANTSRKSPRRFLTAAALMLTTLLPGMPSEKSAEARGPRCNRPGLVQRLFSREACKNVRQRSVCPPRFVQCPPVQPLAQPLAPAPDREVAKEAAPAAPPVSPEKEPSPVHAGRPQITLTPRADGGVDTVVLADGNLQSQKSDAPGDGKFSLVSLAENDSGDDVRLTIQDPGTFKRKEGVPPVIVELGSGDTLKGPYRGIPIAINKGDGRLYKGFAIPPEGPQFIVVTSEVLEQEMPGSEKAGPASPPRELRPPAPPLPENLAPDKPAEEGPKKRSPWIKRPWDSQVMLSMRQ